MDLFKELVWGFCGWEIVLIIVNIVAVSVFLIRRHQLNKEIKKLKDQL